MRIGFGYDIHLLVSGRPLILGGVPIPYERGLLGHSDADALSHAISDALLGAAALGDIGELFPDTDPKYKGADSLKLLSYVHHLLKSKRYIISNIDATVIAQEPKLGPYKKQMAERIAETLELSLNQISVKATTNEGVDSTGQGEAIAVHAVVLISGDG